MKSEVLCFLLLALFSGIYSHHIENFLSDSNPTNIWAVLVAGSQGYGNYRHQADICHAYQVLHNHGIPDERIIVMMVNDIAYNEQNPTPGIIINHPNGNDVYKGVPHDYTGIDVTPDNFVAVLKGDKDAVISNGTKKVLNSGPNDHVFIYFSDHGAPGLIAFPNDELSAKKLHNTIKWMHSHKKYQKLVFYLEACESGSMFQNLLTPDLKAFATSAASPTESSYACYYDAKRETYLGDVYSVKWMEDSDKENLSNETLLGQYKIVKKETKESTVEEYGDKSIGKMHVSEFQGKKKASPIHLPKVKLNTVRSRDVPVEILKNKIKAVQTKEEKRHLKKKLKKVLKRRDFLRNKMQKLVLAATRNETVAYNTWTQRFDLNNHDCYNSVRQHFNRKCFAVWSNEYALEFMYLLVNLCEQGVNVAQQKNAMTTICNHPPVHGIM